MEEDFGKYLEENMGEIVTSFKPGQKVTGIVCAIDGKTVFLDVHSTSEGIINREELIDDAGNVTVSIGDEIEAFYVDSSDGSPQFSVKMSGKALNGQIEEAFEAGVPVEGKVIAERKGGYSVNLAGSEAFCPYSQMTLSGGSPESFIGNSYLFNIQEMDGRNCVVSRRQILEKEREAKIETYKETMKVGDLLTGKVSGVKDFGVFVDLDGVQGFIPVSELSWGRVNPSDIVREGDEVSVSVIGLDWSRNRITLSFRSANTPWEDITGKYPAGSTHQATITRIESYGAFAELEPGLDGLIHISKLGKGRRINSPNEVVKLGDSIEVVIDNVDPDTHRISLALDVFSGKPQAEKSSDSSEHVEITAGSTLKGIVDSIKPFGAFVKLPGGKSGLMHISEAGLGEHVQNGFKAMSDKYPVGSEIEVIVKSVENGKISLRSKAAAEKASEQNFGGSFKDNSSSDLGNIGNLFNGL